MVLVGQIDLDVALFRQGAQVVLADQAVEIDRAGRAGVGLIVGDILLERQFGTDFVQHARRFLKRRADRHVEDDLEFALVVEGQHFQDDELEVSQRHRTENEQDDGNGQLDPRIAPPLIGSRKGVSSLRKVLSSLASSFDG